MRIGFNIYLKDKYLSGVERYSIGLVNALCKYYPGNEYFIFTNSPEHFKNPSNIVLNRNNNRLSRIIWEHTFLPRLAKKYNLDVLHCPHYICPFRRSTVPYVVTIHDTIALDYPGWCTLSNSLYYRIFLHLTAKAAARIIAVSEDTRTKIVRCLGVADSKVTKSYPGLDACFLKERSPVELDEVRNKYHLPDKYLLYVGNIEPKKNIEHVVNAFKLYRSCDNNYRLVIAGKRSWRSRELLSMLRDTDGVILTGYLSDGELACIYKMADMLLFPSKYEGFGFPPLEAMVSGTPVICTSNGALKETVSDAAVIVGLNRPVSTFNAITKITRNSDYRGKLIEKGHNLAGNFTWKKAVCQVMEIYTEVANAK